MPGKGEPQCQGVERKQRRDADYDPDASSPQYRPRKRRPPTKPPRIRRKSVSRPPSSPVRKITSIERFAVQLGAPKAKRAHDKWFASTQSSSSQQPASSQAARAVKPSPRIRSSSPYQLSSDDEFLGCSQPTTQEELTSDWTEWTGIDDGAASAPPSPERERSASPVPPKRERTASESSDGWSMDHLIRKTGSTPPPPKLPTPVFALNTISGPFFNPKTKIFSGMLCYHEHRPDGSCSVDGRIFCRPGRRSEESLKAAMTLHRHFLSLGSTATIGSVRM